MIRTLLFVLCTLACSAAIAKGGSGHSGGSPMSARTQPVSGYERADGTHVNGYMRAPAGTGGSSIGSYSSGGIDGDEAVPMEGGLAGVGSQESITGHAQCEYKGVMTDDEIATCRAAAEGVSARPSRRRK